LRFEFGHQSIFGAIRRELGDGFGKLGLVFIAGGIGFQAFLILGFGFGELVLREHQTDGLQNVTGLQGLCAGADRTGGILGGFGWVLRGFGGRTSNQRGREQSADGQFDEVFHG